jgi:hypothetical protein
MGAAQRRGTARTRRTMTAAVGMSIAAVTTAGCSGIVIQRATHLSSTPHPTLTVTVEPTVDVVTGLPDDGLDGGYLTASASTIPRASSAPAFTTRRPQPSRTSSRAATGTARPSATTSTSPATRTSSDATTRTSTAPALICQASIPWPGNPYLVVATQPGAHVLVTTYWGGAVLLNGTADASGHFGGTFSVDHVAGSSVLIRVRVFANTVGAMCTTSYAKPSS